MSSFLHHEGAEMPPFNPADCCQCLHHICIKEGDFCEFLINPYDFADCVFCQYFEPKNYEP